MGRVWLAFAAALLAGCVATPPPATTDPAPSAPAGVWESTCGGGFARMGEGACVAFLTATAGANYEASLATHPQDPATVLVAWTARGAGNEARVWAAVTRDAGATWNAQELRDPSVLQPPGTMLYAFDEVAGFAPDGTALVLYGGENVRAQGVGGGTPVERITLASSKDGGATWSYRPVAEGPAPGYDYMHLAVAPDTGNLLVAAHRGFPLGAGTSVWRSTDGGATWSSGAQAAGLAAAPLPASVPRVAAGPGGLFLLKVRMADAGTEGVDPMAATTDTVLVSRDDGVTFGEAGVFPRSDVLNGPPLFHLLPGGGTRTVLPLAQGKDVVLARSHDAGATWDPPETVARFPELVKWVMLAGRDTGHEAMLVEWDNACDAAPDPARWSAEVRVWDAMGREHAVPLVGPLGDRPYPCGATDDYGGLAFAADGSLWAAWSDPRLGNPAIAVARLAPP